MRRSVRCCLVSLPLAICSGVALGDTTVSAMQVRRVPQAATPEIRSSEFDLGLAWAQIYRPDDADACPQPNLLFQMGCVAGSRN